MDREPDARAQKREFIQQCRHDPELFARKICGFVADDWQKQAFKAIAEHPKVTIKSGQGVGKTAFEAVIFLWFLCCFKNARIVATAPTRQQLHDVLWSEIAKWQNESPMLKHILKWTKTYVYFASKENSKRWFGVARTATKPENMQGFHEDNMLFIVDEASGVADPIMEAILGTLTGSNNKLLLCGNPTQASGMFYDSFNKDRRLYECLTVSSEDVERTSKDAIESLIEKYGYESNVVRVRVRGLFPKQDDDVFIGIDLLESCSSKVYELPENKGSANIIIGCDVARFGDDETVIYLNNRGKIRLAKHYRGQDLMRTAGELAKLYKQILEEERKKKAAADAAGKDYPIYLGDIFIQIDDTGLGGGVTDRLKEVKTEQRLDRMVVVPINAAEKIETDSFEGKEAAQYYNNLTTHMWATVRDLLSDKDIQIEDDGETFGQMSSRKYRTASNGKLELESKADMKKRGLGSPDRGDALALACYLGKIRKYSGSAPSLDAVNLLGKESQWTHMSHSTGRF